MDDLKAKIEAAFDEMRDFHMSSGYEMLVDECRDRVLAICEATHAAEPAPVAVDHGEDCQTPHCPVRICNCPDLAPTGNTAQCCMCGRKDLSTVEGDGGAECQLPDDRWTCSRECWDKATGETGNTSLVEWCSEHEALVRGCIDLTAKEEATALLWINNFRAALQPAAPQPTPDVDGLAEAREYLEAEILGQWDQKNNAIRILLHALARGSVAEKGPDSGEVK